MPPGRCTLPIVAALFVFATTFIVYAWTASPAIGWLDSPEFVAASASLGVAHSPGHPMASMLGHLGVLVPVGDVPFRVNLVSALMGALGAVGVLYAASAALSRVAAEIDARARQTAAVGAALVFAFSWAAWFQGVRAEVYALQALLIAGALASVLAFDASAERRWLYLAGLLSGLALGNHHLIALVFVIPAAALVFARRAGDRPGARAAGITAMLGIVGLAVFLYLPVRSAAHPEVNWGAPHTAERFAWTVSAKAFQKTAGAEHVSTPSEDAVAVTVALVDNVTPFFALALLLAAYLAVRRRDALRRLALFLFGVAAVTAGARVLLGFDSETPDHYGYLLPAVMALIVLAIASLGAVARALGDANPASKRNVAAAFAAIAILMVPYQLVRFGETASLRHADASDELARWELEELPPRSLVVLAYFQTSFRVWALHAVEHARPDIQVLDRSFMTYPGMDAEARRRYPELAALIDAPLRVGAPTPIDALREIARTRPVFMQLHPNLDRTAEPWLIPAGPFAYFSPVPPSETQRSQLERMDERARAALDHRLGDPVEGDRVGARDAALWHDFVRLSHFCATERVGPAQLALVHAWAIAPGDSMLADIAARCGLTLPDEAPR